MISIILLEDSTFAMSYDDYALFFVSSTAIVNVVNVIRMLRGSTMNNRGI